MTKKQEADDRAIEDLDRYKRLAREVLLRASAAMRSFSHFKAVTIAGLTDECAAAMDRAVADYWALEAAEAQLQPYLDANFPTLVYERPDPFEVVREQTDDPWQDWRSGTNVVPQNNQTNETNWGR